MKNGKVRVFFAIPFPAQLRNRLADTALQLGAQFPKNSVNWVARDNIHLTLKFLGDAEIQTVDRLLRQLAMETQDFPSFPLQLSALGAFPPLRSPRVIWAGCAIPAPLRSLFNIIEKVSVSHGFPSEKRPFSPHITLGRVKNPLPVLALDQFRSAIKEHETTVFGSPVIDSFVLFRSELRSAGSVYTPIHTFKLTS